MFKLDSLRVGVICLLATQALLLAWSASRRSPTWDEVAHLPAGASHWQYGRFDLFRVNPPLVRVVAAAPVVLAEPNYDWESFSTSSGERSEFPVGKYFVAANGAKSLWYFTLARWACIPFSLVGGYVCFRWARELYGGPAGLVACVLWCFCPNILAHGQLITPDVGAAAMGVLASYLFWRWLKRPLWSTALAAGVALGLAELTKFTLIVLFPLWPLLWVFWRCCEMRDRRPLAPREATPPLAQREGYIWQGTQLAAILLLGLYIINVGYGFEGSGTPLGEYQFLSQTLKGPTSEQVSSTSVGNRFSGTWLAAVPVPVPKNYLLGIDVSKWSFELKMMSYLRGEWKLGGWWYYYLYALLLKVPLGTWCLLLLAVFCTLRRPGYLRNPHTSLRRKRRSNLLSTLRLRFRLVLRALRCSHTPCAVAAAERVAGTGTAGGTRSVPATISWRDEVVLLAPALVILVLVSSQTGYNHGVRYVLPIFPLVFIWASKVAKTLEHQQWKTATLAALALTWSVGSSLSFYPHTLSYFNELAGGTRGGPAHLLSDNVNSDGDLLYLKRWLDQHPEARPLGFAYGLPLVDPQIFGIESTLPPVGPDSAQGKLKRADQLGPWPGWYAVSVNELYSYKQEYAYFQHFEPVAMAGYSIYIYHLSLADANRVRRESRLNELAVTPFTPTNVNKVPLTKPPATAEGFP